MAYDNSSKKSDSVYSQRVRAGKRRTYFFDIRETRGSDYYLTITESRRKFNEEGYDRHKIFLYKEDFNKFLKGLQEAVDYVKTDLMPDYDFDSFSHEENSDQEGGTSAANTEQSSGATTTDTSHPTVSGTAGKEQGQADDSPEASSEEDNPSESEPPLDEQVDKW